MNPDLITPEHLAAYMSQATSEADWDARCDVVKEAFYGGYPSFWWETIMVSGLARRTMANFGATPDLKIG
jgi:hypothetical protein